MMPNHANSPVLTTLDPLPFPLPLDSVGITVGIEVTVAPSALAEASADLKGAMSLYTIKERGVNSSVKSKQSRLTTTRGRQGNVPVHLPLSFTSFRFNIPFGTPYDFYTLNSV